MPTRIEQVVQLLAREIPRLSLLTITRTFGDLGVDSLALLKLRTGIEQILGSKFSDREWSAVQTPADLLQLVDSKIFRRPHG
jgi:acyl carrier protein